MTQAEIKNWISELRQQTDELESNLVDFVQIQRFAKTWWTIQDVFDRRPDWDEDTASTWLYNNERRIKEAMIARGWDVIYELLPLEEDEDDEQAETRRGDNEYF